jgi:hypothetical protein
LGSELKYVSESPLLAEKHPTNQRQQCLSNVIVGQQSTSATACSTFAATEAQDPEATDSTQWLVVPESADSLGGILD